MSSGHINLVYFSPSGTTKSVITTLADVLDGEINEFDLLRIPLEQAVTFSADSPTVFAVSVFCRTHPGHLRRYAGKIQGAKYACRRHSGLW